MPSAPPSIGDDFDWTVRDYDSIRRFMLEELAARFPERSKWTPADVEVVIVELLAALLDQLSDMADRVAAEATLETARRPDSVRRLLAMIGYDALEQAHAAGKIAIDPDDDRAEAEKRLDAFWLANPHEMEAARSAGPRAVHTQHRMVTLSDYAKRLEEHPLVLRAVARMRWTGSWNTVRVSVVALDDTALDESPRLATAVAWNAGIRGAGVVTFKTSTALEPDAHVGESFRPDVGGPGKLTIVANAAHSITCRGAWPEVAGDFKGLIDEWLGEVETFNESRDVPSPPWDADPPPTIRSILQPYIDLYRMVGQEVVLEDARRVPIMMSLSVQVASNYFQSEIAAAVAEALGTGSGGFFEAGRLRFGEDLHVSDVIAAVMALDGVEQVCVNRFKRMGDEFPDAAAVGRIVLDEFEIALCDNDPGRPERGHWRLALHGGRRG